MNIKGRLELKKKLFVSEANFILLAEFYEIIHYVYENYIFT